MMIHLNFQKDAIIHSEWNSSKDKSSHTPIAFECWLIDEVAAAQQVNIFSRFPFEFHRVPSLLCAVEYVEDISNHPFSIQNILRWFYKRSNSQRESSSWKFNKRSSL